MVLIQQCIDTKTQYKYRSSTSLSLPFFNQSSLWKLGESLDEVLNWNTYFITWSWTPMVLLFLVRHNITFDICISNDGNKKSVLIDLITFEDYHFYFFKRHPHKMVKHTCVWPFCGVFMVIAFKIIYLQRLRERVAHKIFDNCNMMVNEGLHLE